MMFGNTILFPPKNRPIAALKKSETFSVESLAVFARMPNLLLMPEKIAINNFVNSQVLSGNWSLIDDFANYKLQDENNALTGWKLKTQIAVNAPTFTSGSGFTLNGTTQYIDSNYNPSIDKISLSQTDAFLCAFLNTYTVNHYFLGYPSSDKIRVLLSSALKLSGICNGSKPNDAFYGSLGNNKLWGVARVNGGADQLGIVNGAEFNQQANANQPLQNENILIGASNSDYMACSVGGFVIGGYNGFDISNFYTNLAILNSALESI